MTASRQNIYDRGAYQGDALIHGDNGLGRAIAGRAQHRRAYAGSYYMLVDPAATNSNSAAIPVVAGSHTIQAPQIVTAPQAEQLVITSIYEGTAATSAPSFLVMRFLLNNEYASGWIQPAPFRTYAVSAVGAVLTSTYAAPVMGQFTLSFDTIYFALLAGATLNLNVQGMYATGAARYAVVAPSDV